jgi:hypothetical protein
MLAALILLALIVSVVVIMTKLRKQAKRISKLEQEAHK